jgi:hypothetical protein
LDNQLQRDTQEAKEAQKRIEQEQKQKRGEDAMLALARLAKRLCGNMFSVTREELSAALDWEGTDQTADLESLILAGNLSSDWREDNCPSNLLRRMAADYDKGDRRFLRDIAWLQNEAARNGAHNPMSPQAPAVPPPAATPPVLSVGVNLGSLAHIACDNPEALTEEQMRRLLIGFPDGRDWGRREAHDCKDQLYDELMRLNASRGSLSLDWLKDTARRYKQGQEAPRSDPGPSGGDDDGPRGRGQPRDSDYNHCIDPGGSCLRR